MYPIPTLHDVLRARRVIAPFLEPTPLVRSRGVSRLLGCEAYLKLETVQPIGAFKVRGGINYMAHLKPEDRHRGVITASTGNHGQSIAYAARQFGVPCTIAAPEGSNPLKVAAMQDLGATVVLTGQDFDAARLWVEAEARAKGIPYVHSANEPLLIAGVGTLSLEVMEALPEAEVILVPVGAGSGACGHCIAAKAINPRVRVIGVQAERAPAVTRSWREKRLLEEPRADTLAEGLATRVAFELPLTILWQGLDDMVLVSERELEEAVAGMLEHGRVLAEPAGAAPLAAALKLRDGLRGRTAVLIVSGGNISMGQLRRCLGPATP
ncbi:MAG TPA: threonine/serine dehydratase [Candidatus Methylomirabilis sp.]|jgi:threonine dehydratase